VFIQPHRSPNEDAMSHLIFDTRDWKFLIRDHMKFERVLGLPGFEDYDMETLEAVFEEAVKFAVDRIAPLNAVGDREGCKLVDGRVIAPEAYTEVWHEMRKAGWNSAGHSPEFGGQGLPYCFITPIHEAFNAACQAFEMYQGLSVGAGHLIESFGTEELKARFVEKMYNGVYGGTMCLTEPQAGSSVGDARSSADPLDDGTYAVEGNKIFISAGDAQFYENVVHLVLARVKGDPDGVKGLSLFAVPRVRVNDDGSLGEYNNVAVTGLEHKMGINGSATCAITFGDGAPSIGYLVGERGAGIVHMFQMMNEARIACGLQGVALSNAAYQQARAYAKERKQGPPIEDLKGASTEIVDHPDVRRNLMYMKVFSEGTRALTARLALAADFANRSEDPAERERNNDIVELLTPIVKAYSTDKAFKVTELAVQVFGGYGYCSEYPVEQYLRDCKITSIYEGTNGIQALDLLGRKMRMKGGALFMGYVQELAELIQKLEGNDELTNVKKGLEVGQAALGEVGFWLAQTGGKDRALAMLQATPFLELFGDVVVGALLAEQAVIALDQLESRYGTRNPTIEQQQDDAEVAYLWGKVAGARFFASEVLTFAKAKAKAMSTGERAALEVVF
jgi:alkylation response protein AidB-like acyl-CoA dehydrogenase